MENVPTEINYIHHFEKVKGKDRPAIPTGFDPPGISRVGIAAGAASEPGDPLQTPRISVNLTPSSACNPVRPREMMEYFDIRGGDVPQGEVTPSGNKNEALPVLAAALLADEPVTIGNLPDIIDVNVMLALLEDLGAKIGRPAPHEVTVDARALVDKPLDAGLCRRIRASILLAGPLLGRFGHVVLPLPGGDVIGRRRVDTHFEAFSQLGATFRADASGYRLSARPLRGTDIFLEEQSVTGTENAVCAAVRAEGVTVIHNAACEPHVQRLCRFLGTLGARIEGIGTNRLTVTGVDRLGGGAHSIGPDFMETGSLIALAAVTGGELTIRSAAPVELRMILHTFAKLGVAVEIRGEDLFVPHHPRLVIRKDLGNVITKIDDAPWPAFPTDLMSIAIVIATQAEGTALFFEKMFDGRMFFVDNLIGMGAQIILCDPHRVVVSGPTPLYGTSLESPDIRAGMALLIAAIAAKGRSKIYNIRQIDRGYERVDEKLRGLGISIERKAVQTAES
jgi:UDP-N-acetylglucosamine 1-carboxyvinyltransferase